mmetsp:Transcript_7357/g.13634  ORF Transcript_7357/g.13634 Transcript_7357/m.13634 type:complete len:206 (+) Transcript_7357:4177-4794(+)
MSIAFKANYDGNASSVGERRLELLIVNQSRQTFRLKHKDKSSLLYVECFPKGSLGKLVTTTTSLTREFPYEGRAETDEFLCSIFFLTSTTFGYRLSMLSCCCGLLLDLSSRELCLFFVDLYLRSMTRSMSVRGTFSASLPSGFPEIIALRSSLSRCLFEFMLLDFILNCSGGDLGVIMPDSWRTMVRSGEISGLVDFPINLSSRL